jgi:hypothetical protein
LTVGHVDQNGVYTGTFSTVAFAGYLRQRGEIDGAFNRIAADKGLMKDLAKFPDQSQFKK